MNTPLAGYLALTVTALFTGAAFYINVAEQLARLALDDPALVAQWKPSYARGFVLQASLTVIGSLLGAAAWWTTDNGLWLAGALTLVANWPLTLLAIMPANDGVNAVSPNEARSASRRLIERWGGLHAMRTALGSVSTLLFLAALR